MLDMGYGQIMEKSEDRFVCRECLRLDVVSDSESLCYYSAVFDGHAGSRCAEYAASHLHTSIISAFRQRKQTLLSKPKGRYSSDGVELDALQWACLQGFKITDNNFINMATKQRLSDGCTACVCLVYGPSEDGFLKFITANAGDSRAVLCREGKAVRLTEDHKPNLVQEKARIVANGGTVRQDAEGVWRLAAVSTGRSKTDNDWQIGTSRSLGDYIFKHPQKLVSAVPDVVVNNADLDRDQFIILGTDGIFDVLKDQAAVDTVLSNLHHGVTKAAEALVERAKAAGSRDDITAVVINFSWTTSSQSHATVIPADSIPEQPTHTTHRGREAVGGRDETPPDVLVRDKETSQGQGGETGSATLDSGTCDSCSSRSVVVSTLSEAAPVSSNTDSPGVSCVEAEHPEPSAARVGPSDSFAVSSSTAATTTAKDTESVICGRRKRRVAGGSADSDNDSCGSGERAQKYLRPGSETDTKEKEESSDDEDMFS
eukprot:GHVQ01004952.1.p1 GENE.GHVQ01004952.1~~GHVQ01004952.1.p1  ORF type:complete len:486 (+),score=90.50 GHVQ01004952.1:364-1821(+)